jgi:hypothetical protein
MEQLLAQNLDEVSQVAKMLITGVKFSHLGKDYAPDEKRAACDALDAGLKALTVSSAADGGAPTEDGVPKMQTLGGMLAKKLDLSFYEALANGDLWHDPKQRQRLRANLRVFFDGCAVTTPEELHSGQYATRAAVVSTTSMLRSQAAILTEAYEDQFDLGTDADAMRAAVRRAVTNVLPQMWLEAYDEVRRRPHATPSAGKGTTTRACRSLGDRCTAHGCTMHVCRAAARRRHSGAKVGPQQRHRTQCAEAQGRAKRNAARRA